MKKLIIQDTSRYYGIIAIIATFLIYNIYATLISMNPLGFLPIAIQIALLLLLINKNQYSIKATKIWAGIFLIGASSLKVIGIILQAFGNSTKDESGMELITSQKMIYSLIYLIIGIIVFKITREMGVIDLINPKKEVIKK